MNSVIIIALYHSCSFCNCFINGAPDNSSAVLNRIDWTYQFIQKFSNVSFSSRVVKISCSSFLAEGRDLKELSSQLYCWWNRKKPRNLHLSALPCGVGGEASCGAVESIPRAVFQTQCASTGTWVNLPVFCSWQHQSWHLWAASSKQWPVICTTIEIDIFWFCSTYKKTCAETKHHYHTAAGEDWECVNHIQQRLATWPSNCWRPLR